MTAKPAVPLGDSDSIDVTSTHHKLLLGKETLWLHKQWAMPTRGVKYLVDDKKNE